MAKNLTSLCPDLLIGLFALIVLMADWLSLHVRVCPCAGSPGSPDVDCIHCMFSAAVTAAISSASVELSAAIDYCALDWHTIAPPQCVTVTAHPVADLLFVGLFPHAASTKHTSLAFTVSAGQPGGWCSVTGVLGRAFMVPFRWKMIPQSSVVSQMFGD